MANAYTATRLKRTIFDCIKMNRRPVPELSDSEKSAIDVRTIFDCIDVMKFQENDA